MKVHTEVPPISDGDTFVAFERRKRGFDYPVHVHNEIEINFLSGAAGAKRIMGDSIETITDKELVLIANPSLEHTWTNGNLTEGANIREVTIQFSPSILRSGGLIDRTQFHAIRQMLREGSKGLAFSASTFDKCEVLIGEMLTCNDSFKSVLIFLDLLNVMAHDVHRRILATSQYCHLEDEYEERRLKDVMMFLRTNYTRKISLAEVAAIASMSIPSFNRFIRLRTGSTLVECVNNIRIAEASRLLIENSSLTIADIASRCGFTNLSNFNRIFKHKKGIPPHQFREQYAKTKIII